ncbi:hypothetical protein BH11PSE10_BH11PSE10_07480 [soil metagenome]
MSERVRGFGYLGLLFFVAITAAALAALGQAWSTAAERERERELEFRGNEIARAIVAYRKAQPERPQSPVRLDDLLADRRGIKTRHHLRRAYADPFTGQPDWVLVAEPGGDPRSFSAVHSRSERVLLRQTSDDGTPITKASDWLFSASAYELRQAPGLAGLKPSEAASAAPP